MEGSTPGLQAMAREARRLGDPKKRQRGPPALPRRGGRGGAPPRRARRAYALGDVYTSGVAIYTSRRGGARPGARPQEGARRAGGQGAVRHRAERASQPSAHTPRRRHDGRYAPTKNALATPEGVEGDTSQKLPRMEIRHPLYFQRGLSTAASITRGDIRRGRCPPRVRAARRRGQGVEGA